MLAAVLPLQAAHIIGGEITYDCLGGGNYRFTMKIYRDCAGGGAEFDSAPAAPFNATLTLFEGNNTQPASVFELGTPIVTRIEPTLDNPCLTVPPGICVEEGVYIFDLQLPLSPDSYHIVYQRCCRNNSITNIVDPGNVGATYTTELTAKAQSLCNDSPTFKNFPPIVICAGEPLNFDFSAVDPDGDELTYSLCSPYQGGGPNQNQATILSGVAPNPDAPPPFNNVFFITPPYSAANPMGGNPQIAIDPNTGLITGTPTVQGQFVVGVCVEERRDGELLSVLRRDFQFNVTICEPTVVADILEDEIINGNAFLVRSCGDSTVTFINESFQQQNIFEYAWSFDLNGTPVTSSDEDPTITFPGLGTYQGQLIVNPNTICDDTADIFVSIFPEIVADFEFEYDTCVAGPVTFTDLSYSGAGPNAITDWTWNFGDGVEVSEQSPVHTYAIPGNLPISLQVTDINGCQDVLTQPINYFPVPALVVVAPTDLVACQPATITFNNLSIPIDETYDIVWDFGDGNFGSGVSPTYTYEDPGIFSVAIEITSPIGCYTDTVFPNLIEVRPSPTAGFDYEPKNPTSFQPTVSFIDQSIEAQTWKWEFGGIVGSFEPEPVYTFPDTGLQVVTQIVTHASGCKDTAQALIDVVPLVTYYLPNAFTPNGDGLNEGFRGDGVMEGAIGFQMQIWNRYGELVFESSNPFEAWNGRKHNSGEESPQGVYVVVVQYTEPRGRQVQLKGYATLIR